MKKPVIAFFALLILLPGAAMAQQYVRPIYSQDSGMQPYPQGQTATAPAQQQQAPTPQPLYPQPGQDVLSLSPEPAPAPYYADYAAPASSPSAGDSYATYAANPHPARRGYNWSSCYIGGYGGGAFSGNAKTDEATSQGGAIPAGSSYNQTATPFGYDTGTGFMAGGTLGCAYEVPLNAGILTGLVMGMEAEGGSFEVNGSGIDPNSNNVNGDTHDKIRIGDWDAMAAGRAGLAFDRALIYGKVGAVFTNATARFSDGCSTVPCGPATLDAAGNKLITDAAFGGGIEYALSDDWSLKGEYMYLDTTDSYEVCGPGGGNAAGSNYCAQHQLSGTHTFKIGLNYHFDGFLSNHSSSSSPRW